MGYHGPELPYGYPAASQRLLRCEQASACGARSRRRRAGVAEWQTRQTQNPASATGGRTSTTTTREPLHYGLLALHRPSILDSLPPALSTRSRAPKTHLHGSAVGGPRAAVLGRCFYFPPPIRVLILPTV